MERSNLVAIDLIEEFCENNDHEFRKDYSGRGMYGRTCIGIVTDSNPLWIVLCVADIIRDAGLECAEDILGEPCMDSMGLSTIVYFPRLGVGV